MEHGTHAGYASHIRLKTPVCDPCRQGARIYWRINGKKRKPRSKDALKPKRRDLEGWRQDNPGLEQPIRAVFHGTATPEQQQLVTSWYSKAWGLEPNKTIDP